MAGWKKICCAIDFSRLSRTALHEAADLAGRLGAELTLVHIHEAASITRGDVISAAVLLRPAAERLRQKLEEWRADAERIVKRPVRVALFSGNPATELVRFARLHGFDAIIVGLHEPGPSRFVLGSVVDRVVRGAQCPVLVVHGLAAEQSAVAPG